LQCVCVYVHIALSLHYTYNAICSVLQQRVAVCCSARPAMGWHVTAAR